MFTKHPAADYVVTRTCETLFIATSRTSRVWNSSVPSSRIYLCEGKGKV